MKRVFLLLLACCLLIAPAAAAGGSGTAADPYIIQTAAELQSIQNNLAAYYVLGNDIDMSGYSFTPIGTNAAPFIGSLDGRGYTISDLTLHINSGSVGLFGFVSSSATITNLNIQNFHYEINGIGDSGSAFLIGSVYQNTNTVTISNIKIESSFISVTNGVAGICYWISGVSGNLIINNVELINCIIDSQLSSGGIICQNINGAETTISDCSLNNCIVNGIGYVGGIVGIANENYGGGRQCSVSVHSSTVDNSLIYSTGTGYAHLSSGIIGYTSQQTSRFSYDCIVSNSIILAVQSAYGIAPNSINNCDVINTNVYGGRASHDIGLSYDSESIATGVTNVPNRYLYASGISYTLAGSTATLTLDDRQGAAVIETETGAAATDIWDYGDGTTGEADTHTYAAGIYSASMTISSYLATTPQTFYSTPINIGIPTYTANTITQQDADIVIDAGQLYQAQTQFVLPSTTSDLEFFADNVFVVASGNAVYLIDTATEQIEPVSNTTGTTAEKIYIGEHAAIITDIDGNTAVYQYAENSFDYLASGDNQQIATTQNYAGIIINGELNIYDLSEPRKIGDISASVSQLAGNDYADTFAGYSGSTFYYWWIDNGEIKSGSQTMPNPITEVKQIPQTQNYIITTEKNTITVSVSSIGEYSKLSTSTTELPLTHVQATTIGVTIGVHAPNEIYIVGADGSTAGTYQTGATLNDASISKATGLYAITGGIDQQAYILRKDQSSTWALAQTIRANGALSHTQISTNGQYAAIVNGVNLYLLKLSTSTDTTYYLQGVVISSTGSLYANKVITINGEKVTTDLSGRFTYAVTPGSLYRIVADTTTTEYTATNAALQQIAIKLKPNPFAQSVSYSTDYNADTRNFEMIYTDTRDLTSSVIWVIRETGNQTIVSSQTVQAGQTAYWEVPLDKSFTSYQISMIADRQGTNVENVWIITPDGKSPINIPGLDETGRTIIFGAVLMIFGGLFGVMHSTKGALLTVALAGVMTYLGLLNIPWVIIMVAGTIAVAAILGKGSGGS